jgi:hypothetical protein
MANNEKIVLDYMLITPNTEEEIKEKENKNQSQKEKASKKPIKEKKS